VEREQVCVVTGASTGIGHAVARRLADQGHPVIAIGRNQANLEQLARTNVRIDPFVLDLRDDSAILAFIDYVTKRHAGVGALVHSAGVYFSGSCLEMPVADFDEMYFANVRAPYQLTQHLLPLLEHAKGWVIFMNSSVGIQARANVGGFSATQHALRAIANSLRDEVNHKGIRVLSIYPGRTNTLRIERVFASESRSYQPELLLQPDDVATMVTNALSLASTAEMTDVHIRPARNFQ
jgi:NADP-dependent 3-hydroxy acid dehydrogenase YdfG